MMINSNYIRDIVIYLEKFNRKNKNHKKIKKELMNLIIR